jgi:hypothetical protein
MVIIGKKYTDAQFFEKVNRIKRDKDGQTHEFFQKSETLKLKNDGHLDF